MLGGTVGSASVGGVVGAGLRGEVETHVTALKESTRLGVISSLSVGRGVKVDVAEATRTASLLVADDASVGETRAVLKALVEDVVINGPAEVANPEGGALVALLSTIGLGLLGGRVLLRLLLGLSLLGRDLGLLLLLFLIRVGRVRVGILLLLGRLGAVLAVILIIRLLKS